MTPFAVTALAALAVALLVIVPPVTIYNRFVRQRTLIDESWAQTDVELTRRHDLIPSLVETVTAYAAHEAGVLEALARAREEATAHQAASPDTRRPYEERLGGAVADVLVRAEAYPALQASAGFLQLQDELTNTEDRIAAARRFYNGNVRAYNTRVRTFPSTVIAGMFDFEPREFFEPRDPAARQAPHVDLG